MAQIMEVLLNLLLLRGKFLTTTAAETLQEAITKCLQFKRKIHTEYNTRTEVITPFDNMMEFVNYNSSQYKCEQCDGKNFIIASQVHCDLYKYLNQTPIKTCQNLNSEEHKNSESVDPSNGKADESSENQYMKAIPQWIRSEQAKINKEKKKLYEEHIVDNLHAILKSQEYLFKNIIKLVSVLEKQEIITKHSTKLEKLKQKSTACKDILSNTSSPQLFSNIINNIIEDEITRCRFRHGESKTTTEISLKRPQPQGIEVALEAPREKKCLKQTKKKSDETSFQKRHNHIEKSKASKINAKNENVKEIKKVNSLKSSQAHKTDQEVRTSSLKSSGDSGIEEIGGFASIKSPTQTKPVVNVEIPVKIQEQPNASSQTISTQTHMEIENTKKLIEISQGHFKKFEDKLWHSLTSMKFSSLKGDYVDVCKCAFSNKRHFATTEMVIAKRMRQEGNRKHYRKVIDISNAMFQSFEHKLLLGTVKEEICKLPVVTKIKELPTIESGRVEMETKNPFVELLEIKPRNEKQLRQNKVSLVSVKTDSEVKNERDKDDDATEHNVLKHGIDTPSPSKLKSEKSATVAPPQEIVTAKHENTKTDVQKNSEKTFKNQDSNTVINGNILQKLASSLSETTSRQKLHSSQRGVSTDVKNDSSEKHVKENDKGKVKEVEFKEKHVNEPQDKINLHSTKTQVSQKEVDNSSNVIKDLQVKKTASEPSINKPMPSQNISQSASLTNVKSKEDISKIPDIPPQFSDDKKVPGSSWTQNVKKMQDVQQNSNPPKEITKVAHIAAKKEQPSQQYVPKDQGNNEEMIKNFKKEVGSNTETKIPKMTPQESHKSIRKPQNISVEPIKQSGVAANNLENKPQVPMGDWKKILEHISALAEKTPQKEGDVKNSEEAILGNKSTKNKIVMTKDTLEMQEKRAMSELLEKHTTVTSSSVIEDASFETKIKEAVTRTESLEDKVANLFVSKNANVAGLKEPIAEKSTKTGSVSIQEMRNDAHLIKVNEEAFKDLEATIRTVPVLTDKDTKRQGKGLKTTVESKRRKMDEPAKKNMSTRHQGCAPKPHFYMHKSVQSPIKTSARMSDNATDRLHLYKEVKKQTRDSLPHDKTFLKNSIWQKSKLKSSQTQENQKSMHSLAQPEVEETKSPSPMRRTTKNAMKRQQVITTPPKSSKSNEEKKKSEVNLNETGEVKSAKLKVKNATTEQHPIKICSVNKIVGTRKTFSASFLKEVVHKTLSGNLRRIKWEEKNDEIITIFKC